MTNANKATHTPGPWNYLYDGRGDHTIVDAYGRVLAVTWGVPIDRGTEEANARLIASAPELLEALEDVESKIMDYEARRINWRPEDFLMRVRAAISKARGGQ